MSSSSLAITGQSHRVKARARREYLSGAGARSDRNIGVAYEIFSGHVLESRRIDTAEIALARTSLHSVRLARDGQTTMSSSCCPMPSWQKVWLLICVTSRNRSSPHPCDTRKSCTARLKRIGLEIAGGRRRR